MRRMLKCKIHRARVTEGNLNYEGSITIDGLLMDAADLIPFEMVHVLNVNNGARFQTYVIEGEKGSGDICLNGAAARLASVGDVLIILAYEDMPEERARQYKPRLVYVDESNNIVASSGSSVFV